MNITETSFNISTNANLAGLIETSIVSNLLAAHNLEINQDNLASEVYDANTGQKRYTVKLDNAPTGTAYGLVITPYCETVKAYKVELAYMTDVQDASTVHLLNRSNWDTFDPNFEAPASFKDEWNAWKRLYDIKMGFVD